MHVGAVRIPPAAGLRHSPGPGSQSPQLLAPGGMTSRGRSPTLAIGADPPPLPLTNIHAVDGLGTAHPGVLDPCAPPIVSRRGSPVHTQMGLSESPDLCSRWSGLPCAYPAPPRAGMAGALARRGMASSQAASPACQLIRRAIYWCSHTPLHTHPCCGCCAVGTWDPWKHGRAGAETFVPM